jgi:hypothetical protein
MILDVKVERRSWVRKIGKAEEVREKTTCAPDPVWTYSQAKSSWELCGATSSALTGINAGLVGATGAAGPSPPAIPDDDFVQVETELVEGDSIEYTGAPNRMRADLRSGDRGTVRSVSGKAVFVKAFWPRCGSEYTVLRKDVKKVKPAY